MFPDPRSHRVGLGFGGYPTTVIRFATLFLPLLAALMWGGAPAWAEPPSPGGEGVPPVTETAEGWKVMTPVQLEQAAAAALPTAGSASGAPAAATGQPSGEPAPAAAAATAATPATAAVPSAKPDGPAYLAEDQPFKLKDYEEPKPQAATPWWQTLLSVALKLAIVLALAGGSLVAAKKLGGGRLPAGLVGFGGAKGRNLAVIETTSLGPHQAMHLVSVGGDRVIVVGATPQGLTTLATIDDPQQVRVLLAATSHKGQGGSAFGQLYDMESVMQEPDGDMYRGGLRDVSRRGGWDR